VNNALLSGQDRLNAILNASELRARDIHGAETVEAALIAAIDMDIRQEFVTHPDPYDSLVRWYKNKSNINSMLYLPRKSPSE
jgi:hypothetical protein